MQGIEDSRFLKESEQQRDAFESTLGISHG